LGARYIVPPPDDGILYKIGFRTFHKISKIPIFMNNDYILQQQAIIRQMKNDMQQTQNKLSLVEMKSDYENDDEISLTSVMFIPQKIAIEISKKIIEPLKLFEPHHFYYSEDLLHITIKNVRKMHKPPRFNHDDIVKVDRLFKQIIPQFTSFNFRLHGLVLFPTSVSLIGYCNETFSELIQMLDSGLKKIGLPDDKKYISDTVFFGNITFCRFTQKPSLDFENKVKELEDIYIGEIPVSEIKLVTCNAVCHPKSRKIIADYQLT
jgi:2'-5' RNA ligase